VARALGPQGRLVGLDIQPEMLARFRRKLARADHRDIGNVALVRGDAMALPFADDSFDLVYAVSALPEVPDRRKALAEVKRVLRPGGTLALTELIFDPDFPLRRTTIRLCTDAGLTLDSSAGSFASYTITSRKEREGAVGQL
jgi:ubiquinone/menaquinone biosynthesis C-methylase UbiE